ncbi:MAG: hypothetical protein ACOYT8_00680 [Candidatus Dependentiae bacterium]
MIKNKKVILAAILSLLPLSWLTNAAEVDFPQLVITTIDNKTNQIVVAKDPQYNKLFTINPGLNQINKTIKIPKSMGGEFFPEFDTGIAFLINNQELLYLTFYVYSRTWHHSIYRDQITAHLHALKEHNIEEIDTKKIWRSSKSTTPETYYVSLVLDGKELENSHIGTISGN